MRNGGRGGGDRLHVVDDQQVLGPDPAHRITGTGSVTVTTGGATLPGAFFVRDIAPDTAFTII